MILKKIFLQGYSEQQKNTCTNKLGKKYPAPVFGGEKNVAKQHGCRDRFDQSEKISWFDFQGLV
jgi:pullulanase/glycogen debranching enzyme